MEKLFGALKDVDVIVKVRGVDAVKVEINGKDITVDILDPESVGEIVKRLK